MSDNKLTIACGFFPEFLINTPVSPGGSGWSGKCALGNAYLDGYIFPTVALGGSTFDSYGKLLPAGTPNLPGTSVKSDITTGYLGFNKWDISPLYQKRTKGRAWEGDTSLESGIYVGLGHFSTANDKNWKTFSVRRDFNFGITYYLFGLDFMLRPTIGFGIESIIDINKPDDEATLRDNSRILSWRAGLEFESRTGKGTDMEQERDPNFAYLSLFHYIYSDIMLGLVPFLDYKSMDRDAAVAKSYSEKNAENQESSGEQSAKSDLPTLLAVSLSSAGFHAGDARLQFYKFEEMGKDWQGWSGLLGYHIGRTTLVAVLTAFADRPDVLAPAAFSSFRNFLDLWALKNCDSSETAMAAHFAIGSGMMLLGALANDSLYGRGLSQAGMEGNLATALSPNALDDPDWIDSTSFIYSPFSAYKRSGGQNDVSGSQPSLRQQTNLKKSPLYTAATIATPMLDMEGAGGRAKAHATGSEGEVDYANTDKPISTSVSTTIGLKGALGDDDSLLSFYGHIGAGTNLEWNDDDLEPGLLAEVGAGLDVRLTENWKIGVSSHCSGTLFIHGDATNCSIGLSLTRKKPSDVP